MLELDDIQHILLTRTPAITGRYEFLAFDTPAGGRAWLSELLDNDAVRRRCGRHLGRFRPLGHIGVHVDWFAGVGRARGIVGDLSRRVPRRHARPGRHPGRHRRQCPRTLGRRPGRRRPARDRDLVLAHDEQCRRSIEEHDKLLARTDGVRSLSYLDLNATPPFNYAHDHFGFRDRLSQPVMKGSGEEPTPGSGAALEPGEFILGYPDEDGPVANLPEPEVLSRNGSYMAYRRLEEHVVVFRDYLRENSDTTEDEELLAAKFMGRWRSGAPLVLAPDKDDPELGADPMRNDKWSTSTTATDWCPDNNASASTPAR